MRADYDLHSLSADVRQSSKKSNILAATRQLDCRELLFVVLLECWTELGNKFGRIEGKGLDVCEKDLADDCRQRAYWYIPAITSASLGNVSGALLELFGDGTYLSWWCTLHECGNGGQLGGHFDVVITVNFGPNLAFEIGLSRNCLT